MDNTIQQTPAQVALDLLDQAWAYYVTEPDLFDYANAA